MRSVPSLQPRSDPAHALRLQSTIKATAEASDGVNTKLAAHRAEIEQLNRVRLVRSLLATPGPFANHLFTVRILSSGAHQAPSAL